RITDLVDIFGANVKDLTTMNDLPQMEFSTKPADISEEQLKRIIDAIVTRLKLLIHTSGPIGGKNEMERSYYIDAVLRDIVKSCGEDVQIYQQYSIVGSHGDGRVDYVIKHVNTIICITEAKTSAIEQGICQNFIQLHSACKINLRKRKFDDLAGYDYVYGIVSTGDQWIFTVVSSANELAAANKKIQTLSVNSDDVDDDRLANDVQILVRAILGILQDKIASIEEQPQAKRQRLEEVLSTK
ncbi:5329_t:CDS:2, partial [Paraglomus brasilianum]